MIPATLSHLPVAAQIAAIDFDAKSIVAVAQTGCHAPGTDIMLESGETLPVESVKVGDRLMGPDGPRVVITTMRGNGQMVRISPVKGEPFEVNLDHVLTLRRTFEFPSDPEGGALVDIPVSEYLTRNARFRHLHKLVRSHIELPHRPVPLDPHFVGIMLGDGALGYGSTGLSTGQPELVAEAGARAAEMGLRIRVSRSSSGSTLYFTDDEANAGRPNRLSAVIRQLGMAVVCEYKFVPDIYKFNSRAVRLGVLAGLLDTDGHLSNGGFDYISSSKRLSEDVVFIARSVGLAAYLKECRKGCQTGAVGTYWRVSISGNCEIIPNQVPRKKSAPRRQIKNPLVTGFTVEMIGDGDFYGFTLDGDGRYLMGDFTITHNSGKTMVVPPLEAMRRRGDGSCVLLRQPTRLTTTFVYSGIKHFWPDLKVGISTRDDKQNLDDADIIVFSDGSLSGLLAKRKVSAIYFDEAHLLPIAAELDLAIAKKSGARLRCLSATIDPAPMAEYLGGGAAVHHLEGRVYPIERSVEAAPANVLDRNDHELLWGALDEHVQEAKFDDAGILVFLPTKQMCQEAAEHYESDLPTAFAHGEVRPTDTEAFCKKHAGSAYAIFATTAASAGITIDVEKVVILDEVIDSEVRMGVERQFATRVGDNALLQMAGRAGRIKPGRAVLITPAPYGKSDRDWADVAPRAVVGGCSKTTPFAVLMALAQHGIHRDSEVDLYSKLDPIEMKHARDELVAMRCLDGEGKLTRLGRLVQLTPLEPHMAHLVHTAPGRDAKIAVLAGILMSQQGTFQLVRQKPKEVGPGGILLPPECLHPGSAPMTLAHILQSYAALPSGSRRDWCVRSNLNERILAFTLRDYKAAAESLDDADASDLAEALDFDDADLRARVDAHVASHRSLRKIRMTGTWGKIWMPPPTGMLGCVLDSVLMQAWRAEGYVGHVAGIASIRKARSGSDFATLDFVVLEKAA